MRVLVKRGFSLISDLRFNGGPIYIGRQPGCNIYLPDKSVSRQHAVFFTSSSDAWMIQDLQSANRTTLNRRPVTKMPLRDGDIIGIADFTLEIHLDDDVINAINDKPIDLGDTIVAASPLPNTVCEIGRDSNRPLHLSSTRLPGIYDVVAKLVAQNDEESLLDQLTDILLEQFQAWHVWAGLRETTSGPLTCHGGKTRDDRKVSLEKLAGKKIIREAIDKEAYILLPDVAEAANPDDTQFPGLQKLRSALATPIFAPEGAYGVIYIDNAIDQAPYNHNDLDYLTLISTVLAALVEHVG
ncbi:MAG: FHA domain-containing protein [Sedimentisphaerales bacterium]|nr:FHA domain-containing protein [Sedimentisphaerales bacterium]